MIIENGQWLILRNFLVQHATEIPLLTGNTKLVGNYGFLIFTQTALQKDLHLEI